MTEILCAVIIVLLIVVILILIFKKSKNDNSELSRIQEQNIEQKEHIKMISDQMREASSSLTEIKTMSAKVNDLSDVLSNVKRRGTFIESTLGRVLEEYIPGMYETNVKPNPRADKNVEFAIKIKNGDGKGVTWLPIDAKFPMDRYHHLCEASKSHDEQLIESARKELMRAIDNEATGVKNLYINPPYTTPFAIMYLGSEGLYMEAINDPDGLPEKLEKRGIMLAGPSTIIALLSSLAMGFNLIKINERADEVGKILTNVKQQFSKLDDNFSTIDKGIDMVNRGVGDAKERYRILSNTLDRIKED